jgi:predicted MPP superfamily phosphohydrolase
MGAVTADAVRIALTAVCRRKKIFICERELRRVLALSVYAAALVFIIIGHINAGRQSIRTLELRSSNIKEPLRIVFVSDVHYGRILGKDYAEKFVSMINSQRPQLILIGGDLFDENLFSVRKNGIGASLEKLRADYGVYAVNGNHEFIGGEKEADAYMREHGIRVLQDQTVKAGPVYLAGREDLSVQRATGIPRKPLAEMTEWYDGKAPLIVIDHQPSAVRESSAMNAFLHLSGHTHAGQFFPMNLVVKLMYEASYGYMRIGKTNVYVSSGFGSWGPPVRIGSSPEIAVIDILPGAEASN